MLKVMLVLGAALALVAGAAGCGGGGAGKNGDPVTIVCVDSTKSTRKVRDSYLPDLEKLATEAAMEGAPFYAADCGPNASGTVHWPIHKEFEHDGFLSGELADENAENEAQRLTPRLEQLVGTTSRQSGTPLGEMLAVAAQQCNSSCQIYMFTDGEWADDLLRVRDGVSEEERQRYLRKYVPQLHGLARASVYFVGVGFGTHIKALRLGEAERFAILLVKEAGGRFGGWNVRLGDS